MPRDCGEPITWFAILQSLSSGLFYGFLGYEVIAPYFLNKEK